MCSKSLLNMNSLSPHNNPMKHFYHCPWFTWEDTEAEGGEVPWPSSHSWNLHGAGIYIQSGSRAHPLVGTHCCPSFLKSQTTQPVSLPSSSSVSFHFSTDPWYSLGISSSLHERRKRVQKHFQTISVYWINLPWILVYLFDTVIREKWYEMRRETGEEPGKEKVRKGILIAWAQTRTMIIRVNVYLLKP